MSEPYESLDSQVDRLAVFIMENVPGEPSRSEGAIDTAIRLLGKHYGPQSTNEAERIAAAVLLATENPGRSFEVDQ